MSVIARLLQRDVDVERVVVEPMRRRHLGQILAIEESAYPRPWTRRIFESELDQVRGGSREYVVARSGREVLGYAGVWITPSPDGHEAHVTNVAVAAEARRRGVGTRLMIELAERAIRRGCVAWTLEVRVSSTGAQELYRTFGFAPAGIRTKYYENSEDAIVMWCHDLATAAYRERLRELACPR